MLCIECYHSSVFYLFSLANTILYMTKGKLKTSFVSFLGEKLISVTLMMCSWTKIYLTS